MNTFRYNERDYIINIADEKVKKTKFEDILETTWANAMESGLFRYNLSSMKTRIVPGEKNYVLQLNEKRIRERRKPDVFESCKTPFDNNKFNFNKVKSEEILFKVEKTESDDAAGNHVVMINVSPLEQNHILLVPNIDKCIPQKLDIVAIRMAIELMLLSSNPAWRVGFNSLCALASVNHQHIHAWTLEQRIYLEHAVSHVCDIAATAYNIFAESLKVDPLGETGIHILRDDTIKALAFELRGADVDELMGNVFQVARHLQSHEIPHNLFMTRGLSFDNVLTNTVRIFIFPRKFYSGCKLDSLKVQPFNVACAELSGHIPVYDSDAYERMSEQEIEEIIKKQMIPGDEFDALVRQLTELFNS